MSLIFTPPPLHFYTPLPPHTHELTTSKFVRGDPFVANILRPAQSGDNEMGMDYGGWGEGWELGVFMSQSGLCRSGLCRCQVYVNQVKVTFVFMSQSALCRSG